MMRQKMVGHAPKHHEHCPVIRHQGVRDGVRQVSSGHGPTYKTALAATRLPQVVSQVDAEGEVGGVLQEIVE